MSLKVYSFILLKTKNEVILQTATYSKMTCTVNLLDFRFASVNGEVTRQFLCIIVR